MLIGGDVKKRIIQSDCLLVSSIRRTCLILSNQLQEPTMATQILLPVWYANLLPARQYGAVILAASQNMNYYLPAGISYCLNDLYQLTGFKPTTTFINVLAKWVEILWGCVERSVEWSHLAWTGSLNLWSNSSVEIALSARYISPASYWDNIYLPAGLMYQLVKQ